MIAPGNSKYICTARLLTCTTLLFDVSSLTMHKILLVAVNSTTFIYFSSSAFLCLFSTGVSNRRNFFANETNNFRLRGLLHNLPKIEKKKLVCSAELNFHTALWPFLVCPSHLTSNLLKCNTVFNQNTALCSET